MTDSDFTSAPFLVFFSESLETRVCLMQDFMLGNKLFIVCEYIPHSLLQVLEGTADPLASQPSAGIPAAKVVPCLFHALMSCSFVSASLASTKTTSLSCKKIIMKRTPNMLLSKV